MIVMIVMIVMIMIMIILMIMIMIMIILMIVMIMIMIMIMMMIMMTIMIMIMMTIMIMIMIMIMTSSTTITCNTRSRIIQPKRGGIWQWTYICYERVTVAEIYIRIIIVIQCNMWDSYSESKRSNDEYTWQNDGYVFDKIPYRWGLKCSFRVL